MNDLRRANELMEAGKYQEAHAILEHILGGQLNDGDYEAAVTAYMAGCEYDKALYLFQRYREQTGRELDEVIDWKQADIEEEKAAYLAASLNPQGIEGKPQKLVLYPLNPVNIFLLLFIGIGIFFLGMTLTGDLQGVAINLLGVGMGLFMIGAGVRGLLASIKSDETGLEMLSVELHPSGWSLKPQGFLTLPKRQKIPYLQIKAATVRLYVVNRGQGAGLKLTLQDNKTDILALAPPFLVRDCEKLVRNMRAAGVPVFVQPRALGKDFK